MGFSFLFVTVKVLTPEGQRFVRWMLRYIGEILLNIDDQHVSEVQEWIKKATGADRRNAGCGTWGEIMRFMVDCSNEKAINQKPKKIWARLLSLSKNDN
jgi:hypothetical protein